MELEAMTRYTSPVNPAVFPHLTVVLLAIGMFFTAWFFVYPSLFTDLHFLIRKVLVNFSLKRCWYICILDSLSLRYEVTSTKYTRDLYKELLISLVASLFMGFGVLFLLLWVGIYV
uniref:Dolichyl-diphosphooligosaccharide-protein glycosyltransferase subunit TMEM258 n=1 Tax=Cyprinus carpio TaxID=7962 RepID=A0A8C1RZI2_CYPCA